MPIRGLVLGLLMLCALPAQAAIICSVSASALSFGLYDYQLLTPNDSTSTIDVTCGQETGLLGGDTLQNYNMQLSTGGSASYSPRQMSDAGNSLSYNIYTDPTRLIIWGDDTGGSSSRNGSVLVPGCLLLICADNTTTEPVYGRIPAQQIVPVGSYSDQILVTITY